MCTVWTYRIMNMNIMRKTQNSPLYKQPVDSNVKALKLILNSKHTFKPQFEQLAKITNSQHLNGIRKGQNKPNCKWLHNSNVKSDFKFKTHFYTQT